MGTAVPDARSRGLPQACCPQGLAEWGQPGDLHHSDPMWERFLRAAWRRLQGLAQNAPSQSTRKSSLPRVTLGRGAQRARAGVPWRGQRQMSDTREAAHPTLGLDLEERSGVTGRGAVQTKEGARSAV